MAAAGHTSGDGVAEIDAELARLRAQHDLAMSAFRFDEARALQARIAALEDERRELAASLPESKVAAAAESGVVPNLLRPRLSRRRRPGRRR